MKGHFYIKNMAHLHEEVTKYMVLQHGTVINVWSDKRKVFSSERTK